MKTLGIDEVGRGSLAGPVTMCGVKLTNKYPMYTSGHTQYTNQKEYPNWFCQIKDSKKISEKNRLLLEKQIDTMEKENIIVSASNNLIDEFGIGVCLSHIVYIIIDQLSNSDTDVIIDGYITIINNPVKHLLERILLENHLNLNYTTQKYNKLIREPKADDKYFTVATASILAKNYRDNLMSSLHKQYPQYEWDKNKGYGTAKHREIIRKNPSNKYLRKTWLTKIITN